jgi:glycosyltransferase involved in cell wall biosynthesis
MHLLDALFAEPCTRREVHVVVNGPADERTLQALSERPVNVLQEPQKGASRARNRAVRVARGEILAFLDDDVVLHPGWLHALVAGFAEPEVGGVAGLVKPEGPGYYDQERYRSPRALSHWSVQPGERGWYRSALSPDMGLGCNMSFRREFLERCSFPEDMGAGAPVSAGEEFYMFVQALKHGYVLRHTPDAVVTHPFEEDPETRRARIQDLHTAAVVLRLKLLFEERGYRGQVAGEFLRQIAKFIGQLFPWRGPREPGSPRVLLSPRQHLSAYWRGLRLYRASRGLSRANPAAGPARNRG